MLLPLLFAAFPEQHDPPLRPDPPTPREPEPDIPDGAGISDPDLAPGAPLSPPASSPLPAEEPDDPSDWDAPFDTTSLPPDHPAYDRIQEWPDDYGRRRSRVFPLFAGILLVLIGLLATFLILRPKPGDGATPDLLTLAAARADAVQLDLATSDLDEAEDFILGEFGWPIRVPVLPGTRLEGVGVAALTEGVEVPVLVYQPDDGAPITVYAYDYAFLDAATDYLRLAPPVYARLAEEPSVDVRRVGEAYLVLWRRRAAIYTAVTPDDPAPLVEYLSRR